MSLINVSLKHGHTLDEARQQMESAVAEVNSKFGPMVQRVDWSVDRNTAKIVGRGFEVEMRADPEQVHLLGDIHLFSGLLGQSMTAGLKGIMQRVFQKRLA